MNKSEFVKHISTTHNCKQTEAEKVIDMFVSSVTGALAEGNEVGGLKLQMRHIKIYDIKINNLL